MPRSLRHAFLIELLVFAGAEHRRHDRRELVLDGEELLMTKVELPTAVDDRPVFDAALFGSTNANTVLGEEAQRGLTARLK